MIDQCHLETDIETISCLISLSLTLKYFIIKEWRLPGVFMTLWALALVYSAGQGLKVCKKKNQYHGCEGQIEKSIPRIHSTV